jgi:uridine kinase
MEIARACEMIAAKRREAPSDRALLVGISGIDGSGKGYTSARLAASLRDRGYRVAVLSVDGWLNLPSVRFNLTSPAEHFYRHAIRFEELFTRLVLPLRDRRSVHLLMDFTDETAKNYRPHTFDFQDIDIVLLEGIFLLKIEHRPHFDMSLWVDCTFETALERALERVQEGLPPEETVRAYETIFFPAQRIHLAKDRPREAASVVINNDARLIRA